MIYTRTSRLILIFIFNISTFVFVKNAGAQDSLGHMRNIYMAFDISKPVLSLFQNNLVNYEVGVGINSAKKFDLTGDFGYASNEFKRNNYNWAVNSFYVKAGVNKDIFRDGNDVFSYGFRLAGTYLNQEYKNVFITDSLVNTTYAIEIDPFSSLAFWGEALVKLDIHLTGNFSFGWMMRFKFPFYMPPKEYFKPYYVPGYGKTNGSATIGFNYCLYYTFPIKKP